MRRETDLAKIKALAHIFLEMDIEPTDHAPMAVPLHPGSAGPGNGDE